MEPRIKLGTESKKLLNAIRKHGPMNKVTMCEMCGFPMSSLGRFFEPLLETNLVKACGMGDSSGGRRPTLFDVRENSFFVAGVNISSTCYEILILNLKADVLSHERFPLNAYIEPDEVLDGIGQSVSRQISALGIDKLRVLGVGLSTIGPFDRERRMIRKPIVLHLNERWVDYPVCRVLERICGMEVFADVGVNNTAIAEYLYGSARDVDKLFCVRCGMSIKSSYIMSGMLMRTCNNTEDAFGHMSVDIDGLPCVCGNFGCIECYSSIPAIEGATISALKKGRVSSLAQHKLDTITYLEICAAAQADDALAVEIITQAATVLGSGLTNHINMLNPEIILMDGLLIRNSPLYFETATGVAKRKSSLLTKNIKTIFQRNGCFEHSAAVGAGVLALEAVLFGM